VPRIATPDEGIKGDEPEPADAGLPLQRPTSPFEADYHPTNGILPTSPPLAAGSRACILTLPDDERTGEPEPADAEPTLLPQSPSGTAPRPGFCIYLPKLILNLLVNRKHCFLSTLCCLLPSFYPLYPNLIYVDSKWVDCQVITNIWALYRVPRTAFSRLPQPPPPPSPLRQCNSGLFRCIPPHAGRAWSCDTSHVTFPRAWLCHHITPS
jgi:hypothetical protein